MFEADGGVRIMPPVTPWGGTEVEGEPQTTEPIEIARWMDFAYRCGQIGLIEKMRAARAGGLIDARL